MATKPSNPDRRNDAGTVARADGAPWQALNAPLAPGKPGGKHGAAPRPQKRTAGKGRARVGKARGGPGA